MTILFVLFHFFLNLPRGKSGGLNEQTGMSGKGSAVPPALQKFAIRAVYSCRKAVIGLMRMARAAGKYEATSATVVMTPTEMSIVKGS